MANEAASQRPSKTWWCPIDSNGGHASYEELKHRRVVAQGWKDLGDLRTIARIAAYDKALFVRVIQARGDLAYGAASWWQGDREERNAPYGLWCLFLIGEGDLVVGIEGTTVRGICQMSRSAVEGYQYMRGPRPNCEREYEYEYAQTIGPVTWIDWNEEIAGPPPSAPAQSVRGIHGLQQEALLVHDAWRRLNGLSLGSPGPARDPVRTGDPSAG